MTTDQSYLQSVYKVIAYIKSHYQETLNLDDLARIGGFSKYHFHRIFRSVVGESIGNYITRIRLQSTTRHLKSRQRITDIAMESGI